MDFSEVETTICLESEYSINRFSNPNISKKEEHAIINTVKQSAGYYDIISATHKIRTLFDSEEFERLLVKFSNTSMENNQQLLAFILTLLDKVLFAEILNVLCQLDFRRIATGIQNSLKGDFCRDIGRAELYNGTKMQRCFHRLKSLCDDNAFKCRKGDLEKMSNKLISKITNPDNYLDIGLMQKAVNELAIVTWLRVQQCERSDEIRKLINELIDHGAREVDTFVTELVYLSKLAVAAELDGNCDIADEHLQNALMKAEIYSDPLTKSLLIHDKRYIHQLRFMRNKTEDDRHRVQLDCYDGLRYFSSGETDFSTFMKRIKSLYTVHNLLKIGHNFEVDPRENVQRMSSTQQQKF